MKADKREALNEFVLRYEELPPPKRYKNKKNPGEHGVLVHGIHDRPTDYTFNRFMRRRQKGKRSSSEPVARTYIIGGKKIIIFPPSFFRH